MSLNFSRNLGIRVSNQQSKISILKDRSKDRVCTKRQAYVKTNCSDLKTFEKRKSMQQGGV